MSEDDYIDDAIARLENAFIAQVDPSAVAAMVIETVQGEAGFIPCPPRFLQRIRELCTQHGIVMVSDEVQCGFGRTGKLFAVEHYGIAPDLIVTAKSLAAGMPLAAVTGRADLMDGPHPGGLGGTYSGNPLACVAAVEAITMIRQPEFLHHAEGVGARLYNALCDLQVDNRLIGDVRGLGAMILMELVKDPASKIPAVDETLQVTQETLKRGLITIRAGLYSNCVRFLPPLNISFEQLDEGLAVLGEAVRTVSAKLKVASSG
jgi:4-aminobutyrate aminotransferase/(S)-3-amino-2-methylpropionate transaminase